MSDIWYMTPKGNHKNVCCLVLLTVVGSKSTRDANPTRTSLLRSSVAVTELNKPEITVRALGVHEESSLANGRDRKGLGLMPIHCTELIKTFSSVQFS
ncbi:hypothetical protein E2C01_079189 [Portunus trituberculatus]|uniref:Uncharacterized protein n=1 Tax=Portunus trituberculatus TaxID=210409 RepID=A0A5B7IGA9_PORTR|nr:hypothetical protein [Portunus trituberculatus]